MARILHLSDLHFGTLSKDGKTISSHYFTHPPSIDQPNPASLAAILHRDALLTAQPPDVVVVSGDVAWSGASSDYCHAEHFFKALRARWEEATFVVAPGNHDVDRTASSNTQRQDAFVELLRAIHSKAFDSTYPLWRVGARARLIAIHEAQVPEGRMLIVAVNSAAHLQDEDTPVFIDAECLEAVSTELAKRDPNAETTRIFVLHHHLLPFAEPSWVKHSTSEGEVDKPDNTFVANSARLQSWLARHDFALVLHGHKHLSHGRQDTLWRRQDPRNDGRRLVVVGAGSAGVEAGHLGREEPHSFNVIDLTRLSTRRWAVDVKIRQVRTNELPPDTEDLYQFTTTTGRETEKGPAPLSFHADRMDDCHRAIRLAVAGRGLLTNFLSVVEDATYYHPEQSARFKTQAVSLEQVEKTFDALHPEYGESEQWTNVTAIDRVLSHKTGIVRFEHGSRFFADPAGRHRSNPDDFRTTSPIHVALNRVRTSPSKAYLGLYRPEVDVSASETKPMPGLVGIQFVKRGERTLDIVATFRKIELSYWWVVNMMELGRVLAWATHDLRMQPGRITCFAALAQWMEDPEAAIMLELDRKSLAELTRIVLTLRNLDARRELMTLLEEKAQGTNENNLDSSGIGRLLDLLKGALHARQLLESDSGLVLRIGEASRFLEEALRGAASDRQRMANKVANELLEAVNLLRRKE